MDIPTDPELVEAHERIAYLNREAELMQAAMQIQAQAAERQKQAYYALNRQNDCLRVQIEELEARLLAYQDIGGGI